MHERTCEQTTSTRITSRCTTRDYTNEDSCRFNGLSNHPTVLCNDWETSQRVGRLGWSQRRAASLWQWRATPQARRNWSWSPSARQQGHAASLNISTCVWKSDWRVTWNKSASMLASIFTEWAIALNSNFAVQKRNFVLLMDNSSAHRIEGCEVKVWLL